MDPITESYLSQPSMEASHAPHDGSDLYLDGDGGGENDAPPPLLGMLAAELRRCRAEAAELRVLLADSVREAALLREQLAAQVRRPPPRHKRTRPNPPAARPLPSAP